VTQAPQGKQYKVNAAGIPGNAGQKEAVSKGGPVNEKTLKVVKKNLNVKEKQEAGHGHGVSFTQ